MVKVIESQYYLDVTGIEQIKSPEYKEALKALNFHGWTKIISEPTVADVNLLKQFYNSVKFYKDGSIGGRVNKTDIKITADDFHTVYNLKNTGGYPSTSKKGDGNRRLWDELVVDKDVPYKTQIQRTDMSLKNYLLSAVVHRIYHLSKGSGTSIPFPVAAVVMDLNSIRNINWCQAFFTKLTDSLDRKDYKHGRILTGIILHKLGLSLPKEENEELLLSTSSFKEYYLAYKEPSKTDKNKKRSRDSPAKEESKKKKKVTTEKLVSEEAENEEEETHSAENVFEEFEREDNSPRGSAKSVSTSAEYTHEEGDDKEEIPVSMVQKKKGITFKEPVVKQLLFSNKATESSKGKEKQVKRPRSKPSPKPAAKNVFSKQSKSIEQLFAEKKEVMRKQIEAELYQSLLTKARDEVLQNLTEEEIPENIRSNISKFAQAENKRLSKELAKKEKRLSKAAELIEPWTLRSLKKNAERFVKEKDSWKKITESIEQQKAALTTDETANPTEKEIAELKLEILELRAEMRRMIQENTDLQIDVQRLTTALMKECAFNIARLFKESDKLPYRPATCMLRNKLFKWQTRFSRTVLPKLLETPELRPTLTNFKINTALEILSEPEEVEERKHRLDGTYKVHIRFEESDVKFKEISMERAEQLRKFQELANAELPETETGNLDTTDQTMEEILTDKSTQLTIQQQEEGMVLTSPTPLSTIPHNSLEILTKAMQTISEKQILQEREKEEDRKRYARLEEENRRMREEQQKIRSDQQVMLQNQDSQKIFNDNLLNKLSDVLELFKKAPAFQSAPPPAPHTSVSTPSESSQPPPPSTQAPSIPPPPTNDDKRGEENASVEGEKEEQGKVSATTTPMDLA